MQGKRGTGAYSIFVKNIRAQEYRQKTSYVITLYLCPLPLRESSIPFLYSYVPLVHLIFDSRRRRVIAFGESMGIGVILASLSEGEGCSCHLW